MTATRIILAPEFDRYAGKEPPVSVGDWVLIDAGPFELDDKPGRLFVLVECRPKARECGKRRYALRTQWFRGKVGSRASMGCTRCYRAHGQDRRSKGVASYVRMGAKAG